MPHFRPSSAPTGQRRKQSMVTSPYPLSMAHSHRVRNSWTSVTSLLAMYPRRQFLQQQGRPVDRPVVYLLLAHPNSFRIQYHRASHTGRSDTPKMTRFDPITACPLSTRSRDQWPGG